MSATTPPMRPGTIPAEDAVRRYVDAVRHDLEPDPLFRCRLRGTVMNRFVAEREGTAWPELPSRHMMGPLGRACLYASLATALGVSGVMAASEASMPGDVLYPLKLSIEDMRAHVAPAHLQDELATYALAERIDELGRLVESGDLARATELATSIGTTYEQLASTAANASLKDDRLEAHLARLAHVLERVPANARQSIVRAMSFAPGLQADTEDDGQRGNDGAGSSGNGASGDDRGPQGAGSGSVAPERTEKPARTPEPSLTPEPTPTPAPQPTERPERSARPEPPPRPDPSPKPDREREPTPTGP